MTTRKGHTEATETDAETAETAPETAETVPASGDSTPDLANVDTAAYTGQLAGLAVEGATGTPIDPWAINDVGEPGDVSDALANLKALGNANPDVNVTAVLNSHGTWTWTARANDTGRELAKGGPHYADRLIENLNLLFGGSTVALHATGVEKARRLA